MELAARVRIPLGTQLALFLRVLWRSLRDTLVIGMRFFSRRNLILISLVIVIVVGAYLTIIKPMFEQKDRTQVVPARHQDFIIATGSVAARDDVVLSFESSGSVEKVRFSAGDVVSQGEIIALLNVGTLQADAEAQRLRVDKESIRLGSFVNGPEENQRSKVAASIAVSEKVLGNEAHVALVSAQQVASNVENMVRTEFDVLFEGSGRDMQFKAGIAAIDKQRVNRIRDSFEDAFSRWRVWLNSGDITYRQVVVILRQFEKDLRLMHGGVVEIYDLVLPFRASKLDDESAFLLSANLRGALVSAIVDIARRITAVEISEVKHQLVLAQSKEDLAGSTQSDREEQNAQVDIEKERLRRLELQLAKTQVRAPFDGVVGEVFVGEGEFVSAGSSAVRFVSQSGFDLSVDVTEVEIQDIVPDQEMKASVEASGIEISVRVRTIDVTEKRINDVPVYTVVFDVIDDNVMLRPGMTVDVYVPSGEETDVFSVPKSAVVRKDGKSFVLIERGGDSMLVPIVVGSPLDDGFVAVTGELLADDVVVFNKDDD